MKLTTPADPSTDNLSIVFNASKNECFKVNDNYRIFQRKTKATYSNMVVNKEMITAELLRAASLFICTGPRDQFTINELNCFKSYLNYVLCFRSPGSVHYQ
uniref:Intraflagellar transport protein 52 homolog n=1 Tax=Cacopsylla melanoneura TaxID=428564 RepID=A0A8D8VQZ5_9HEMI